VIRTSRLLALSAVTVLALGGAAVADGETSEPSQTRLFLANDGADCGTGDAPFLTTATRTTDLNCGYIGGGLPFGEVFHQSGDTLPSGRTFSSRANAGGVPFTADAARDVAGVVRVRQGTQQGVGLPGAGQVIADVAMVVRVGKKSYDLGAQSLEVLATPDKKIVELPFTFDLPAAVQGLTVTAVDFDLNVRGVHVFHGFMVLNGQTFLDVPTVPAATTTP
jgi:hypothetical protein